ncbi:hypothetical protein D3C72_1827530 [compost metagenome]
MLIQQRRLLHHHFGRHFHQFGISTYLRGFTGNTDHPYLLAVKTEGQIDAGPHSLEVRGSHRIDFHHPVFGQRQNSAFMTLKQA